MSFCWAWWLLGNFGALRPEDRRFEFQVLHSRLPIAFRRLNSDTVSIL